MTIIRNNSPKDAVVNDIIGREWAMFQKTQNIGGRAACQDQFDTFYVNRYAQHSAWQAETLESYRNDLIAAEMVGRNLITEKYGYMMEFTDPAYYNANLRDRLPALSEEKAQLIAEIVSLQLIGYQAYAKAYPALARGGRPAEQSGWDTSIRDYSVGEYRTYSENTLRQLLRDMKQMDNPVLRIQKTLVSFYGFDSLEKAEAAQRR
ncbi:MAG: DUF4125 family protein [Firmicutes bacterium]|nr:DUF4125 family protein [Bacillota bacterium]